MKLEVESQSQSSADLMFIPMFLQESRPGIEEVACFVW